VQLGTGAVQGVRRPSEVQGCEPEQELKDCCCRCAQSRRIQHLEVFEGCRKECVQEFFLKDSELGKAQEGIGLRVIVEGEAQGSCALKCLRRHRKFACRWTSSTEEHLVISQISSRRNGRSVFSEENSRIP
jgi:hypothetical protein